MPNLPMITWPGKGKVQMRDIKELALAEKNYITEQRRYFHSHPELGGEEVETTKHLVEELEKMGVEVQTFSDITGCVGIIKGKQPGKTVLLRSDIDALPMQEADLTKPYASQNHDDGKNKVDRCEGCLSYKVRYKETVNHNIDGGKHQHDYSWEGVSQQLFIGKAIR